MAYRRNTLLLTGRLVIILAVMLCIPLAISLIEPDQLVFTFLFIFLCLVLLVIELFLFLNRTNLELSRFLENIRNREFSIRFNQEDARGSRRELYSTFNEVLKIYHDIRMEREVQLRFLDHIVELIDVGIMVLNQHDKVVLANTSVGNFLGVPAAKSWEQVRSKNADFAAAVEKLEGSGRELFTSGATGIVQTLMVQVALTTMLEEPYKLITCQDVQNIVEDRETGAWLRLMRTLNHEIKNSVTPISSLADTLVLILKEEDGKAKTLKDLSTKNLEDIYESVMTLQQRSRSLHAFIGEYNKLTKIPAPNPEDIMAVALLEEAVSFFNVANEYPEVHIAIEKTDPGLTIRADYMLVQQVLINLIRNSLEALGGTADPAILLSAAKSGKIITMKVEDNGEGIAEDIYDDVFVPFYSTKKQGSGIGLSLARQIMRMHGGNVRISSKSGEGTIVYLDFQG
jgi:nitrogen fixation/metabolism regulation signal transduction histidine kinase